MRLSLGLVTSFLDMINDKKQHTLLPEPNGSEFADVEIAFHDVKTKALGELNPLFAVGDVVTSSRKDV